MTEELAKALDTLSKIEQRFQTDGNVAALLGLHFYLYAMVRLVEHDLHLLGVHPPKID